MTTLVGVFLAIIIVLNVMLRRIVINPMTRMAEIANNVSRGEPGTPEFDTSGNDEITVLAQSFTRMRRSLEKAINMLPKPRTVKGEPPVGLRTPLPQKGKREFFEMSTQSAVKALSLAPGARVRQGC